MLAKPAPTDQRAGVRPISFVLDDAGALRPPVTLSVRPEDLSRSEPLRATVHQTIGRSVSGWVDSFGEGLPSLTIAGHTGWRYANGSGMDGAQAFDALNQLVAHDFPEAQQQAIERGMDPSLVQLLFVDMLDGFAYSVIPTQFVLRRSKSRPLLYQYNISLQATAPEIDIPRVTPPEYGGFQAGLGSLDMELDALDGWLLFDLEALIRRALALLSMDLVTASSAIMRLLALAVNAFRAAGDAIRGASNFSVGASSPQARIAADLARVGTNILRTLTAITLLPTVTMAELGRVASHFNTVLCLFSNSLRDRQNYEDYSPLYGSSGCSSTTGGRPASRFAGTNTFAAIEFDGVGKVTSEALASIAMLATMDPVLSPMSFSEIARHSQIIAEGVSL
jgi:hypothetical protein